MTPVLYAPIAVPVAVAALCALAGHPRRAAWAARVARWSSTASALAQLAAGIALGTAVVQDGPLASGPLRADGLSAFMVLVIGAVAVIATWSAAHDLAPGGDPAAVRRHLVLVQLFLAAMAAAVLADNLGLVWVALEATTIVTAFLVGHHRDRAGAEAAWKYMVLCSVGIALAFLATVCLNIASLHAGAEGSAALDWSALSQDAARLDHDVLRLAAALAVLGFGTKAGLAPMHAWLPDAHSQAPAPVSALMSGVLLAVAFTQILRYKAIADAALGPGYMRALLVAAALLSLAVAAALLIGQRDYKRMLAYSSIEHMGLAALGAAAGGPLATSAVLLHLLGHGLGKAVLFCGAATSSPPPGRAGSPARAGSRPAGPALAAAFGLGLAALLGLPPFSLFASEIGIARAAFGAGLGWAAAAAFALVLVIAAALARHGAAMILGAAPAPDGAAPAAPSAIRARPAALAPLVTGLVACAALGLALGPLNALLTAAAAAVGAP
ncbi:proton-conducting transporter transmembrane domain-containing protein [Actinomadura madurae]|uniref:proton-conducting transporter transmembrane domain-containing protein n=1 Tax=Actinomadura madurae TaxID=1993 RepID=UPI0020D257B7|nr:proton-conducting transporter membrane subunit [Actinomadura madurae]MCQ0009167.1 hydrogenase [Actinomadura madurae]